MGEPRAEDSTDIVLRIIVRGAPAGREFSLPAGIG